MLVFFLYFFLKKFVSFTESSYICTRPSQSHVTGRAKRWSSECHPSMLDDDRVATEFDESQDIDGILRPTMPFVGQAKGKGVYERYHSVHSNFAHLNHFTEVMQQ